MNASDIEMWQTNIESLAGQVAEIHGLETISFIFSKYGASDFDDLDPAKYSEVFAELLQYTTD